MQNDSVEAPPQNKIGNMLFSIFKKALATVQENKENVSKMMQQFWQVPQLTTKHSTLPFFKKMLKIRQKAYSTWQKADYNLIHFSEQDRNLKYDKEYKTADT